MAWEWSNPRSQIKGEILIGVPYKTFFSPKFITGLMSMQFPEAYAHSVYFETGQPVDIARNMMVSNALQRNVSHLLFLDQDINLPRNDIVKELEENKLPIVAAVYYARNPPYNAVANISGKPLKRDEIMSKIQNAPNQRALMEVHDVGMGCVLIDTRVFRRMALLHNMEWFCMLRHPDQLDNIEKDDTGISYSNEEAIALNYRCKYCNNTLISNFFDYRIGKTTENALSEDYYFCKKARECVFSSFIELHPHLLLYC